MTLEEQENNLFKRWKDDICVSEDDFAKDGVADEKLFNNAKYKILYVLKETNGTGKTWDSRKYLKSGVFYRSTQINPKTNRITQKEGTPISKTFNNIYRWTNLFLNDTKEYKDFEFVPYNKQSVEEEKGFPRVKLFSQIGMINLKKTTGKATTNQEKLKEHIDKYNKYINEQISLYKPNIVICCGGDVYNGYKKAMGNVIDENKNNGKFRTSKYIGEDYETLVIDFFHPQARSKGSNKKNQFELLKSIKEQYKF